MDLLSFQRKRVDARQRKEWESLLDSCSEMLQTYGVDRKEITDWAMLETALGKTAIHFNYFNIPGDVDKAHNYLTRNVISTIGDGAQAPSRWRIAKFHSPEECLEVGCAMISNRQRQLLPLPPIQIHGGSLGAASQTDLVKNISNTIIKNTVTDQKGQTFAMDLFGNVIQLVSTASGKAKEGVALPKQSVPPEILAQLEEQNKKDKMMIGLGLAAAIAVVAVVMMKK